MKFKERWRLAGIIASEVRLHGYIQANPTSIARTKENPEKIAKSIRFSATLNAFLSTMIISILALLSLAMIAFDDAVGNADVRMAIGYGLFLLFSFVILFFLNLTTTTGFFSSGAMRLPSALPLSKKELENLSILAFTRVFIAPAVLLIVVYPIACLFLFGPITALLTLIGCVATVAIAMGALLGFAKWFYKKTHTTDESKLSTIVRLAATFGMVLGFLSVYMIANILPEVVRIVVDFATSFGSVAYTLMALLYPFSFGFLTATVTYGVTFDIVTTVVALATSGFYCFVAVMAFRKAGNALRSVSAGGVTEGHVGLLREVSIEITSPLRAIASKDLKLATKNIGSAFVFVIPLFLAFMLYPMISFWGGGVRSMTALTAVEYANLFAGISMVSILMFDSQGASIQEGLPQSTRMTLNAKTAIAFPIYVFSIIVVFVMLSLQPLFTPLLLVIPLAQIPVGYAISMIVGGVMYKIRGGGRAVAISMTSDSTMVILAGAIAGLVGIIPLVGYGLAMILTGNHVLCLTVQFTLAIAELFIAHRGVSLLLKD